MSSLKSVKKAELPEKAGLAELSWEKDYISPRREDKFIFLPREATSEFYLLKDGEQFLAKVDSDRSSSFSNYYFGGADEQPFLVRVLPDAFTYFLLGGEDGFYEALKPEMIVWAERMWGYQIKRQGNIFAYPLPCNKDLLASPLTKDL